MSVPQEVNPYGAENRGLWVAGPIAIFTGRRIILPARNTLYAARSLLMGLFMALSSSQSPGASNTISYSRAGQA